MACRYLNIPTSEGIVLAFLLNLKGHPELLLIGKLPPELVSSWHAQDIYSLVATVTVLNTVFSGPAVAFVMRKEERYFSHKHTSLESYEPESELRILACVYGSRHVSAQIGLIWALSGTSSTSPVTAYLMHLVELPKHRTKKNLMYHELKDGDDFSEEEYGGNDVVEINDVVDSFGDTKFLIHQVKIVSALAAMYEEVCNAIEDLRISIIFLTFHKHQRLDGKLETGKPGIRTTNQKVLRHAPCSVGIFVDRGQTGFQLQTLEQVQNVAVLFFGGPDDREALACTKRIASHPFVHVTLIRFVQATSSGEETKGDVEGRSNWSDEVLMEIPDPEIDGEIDNACVHEF
ncbi:Cation/H(+) antiporter 2 [Linum perenne]